MIDVISLCDADISLLITSELDDPESLKKEKNPLNTRTIEMNKKMFNT